MQWTLLNQLYATRRASARTDSRCPTDICQNLRKTTKGSRPTKSAASNFARWNWFCHCPSSANVMKGLGTEWQVGHPAEIRAAEPRKQQHDWRDTDLILTPLVEERFPSLCLATEEL